MCYIDDTCGGMLDIKMNMTYFLCSSDAFGNLCTCCYSVEGFVTGKSCIEDFPMLNTNKITEWAKKKVV